MSLKIRASRAGSRQATRYSKLSHALSLLFFFFSIEATPNSAGEREGRATPGDAQSGSVELISAQAGSVQEGHAVPRSDSGSAHARHVLYHLHHLS